MQIETFLFSQRETIRWNENTETVYYPVRGIYFIYFRYKVWLIYNQYFILYFKKKNHFSLWRKNEFGNMSVYSPPAPAAKTQERLRVISKRRLYFSSNLTSQIFWNNNYKQWLEIKVQVWFLSQMENHSSFQNVWLFNLYKYKNFLSKLLSTFTFILCNEKYIPVL